MNETTPIPQDHYSYEVHRHQFWLQIFLPVILVVLIIVIVAVLIGISALNGTGDSTRWAAISTIWLVIPVMIFGLVFLALLGGLVFLLARTLQVLPPYSSDAQYYLNRAVSQIKLYSDKATEPVLFIEAFKASVRAIFGRSR